MKKVDHEYWMRQALICADRAESIGEVPVGAVVVRDHQLLAEGWNRVISDCDPTAHAEIVALRAAAQIIGNYRLVGCSLYVTLEPCAMCVGSLIHARLDALVYGATDAKAGAVKGAASWLDAPHHNHRLSVVSGVLAEDCGQRLTDFFRRKRQQRQASEG